MHIVRNAILLGAAVVFLPWAGADPHLHSTALQIRNRVTDLVQNISRDWGQDFRPPVVRIHAEPTTASEVVGLGNPGDRVAIDNRTPGPTTTCPDGSTTAEWVHLTDRHTRVSGYVSTCDLVPAS